MTLVAPSITACNSFFFQCFGKRVLVLGIAKCSLSGASMISKLKLKGALLIGLAYGISSGSCTFGFIAPILATITVKGEIAFGLMLILLFALGPCLPIAVTGRSTAKIQQLLDSSSYQRYNNSFRKLVAVLIACVGGYFVVKGVFL